MIRIKMLINSFTSDGAKPCSIVMRLFAKCTRMGNSMFLFFSQRIPAAMPIIILVCAGVVAALFANQIDKVARQNNVIKTILNIVVVLLALLVLLQILLNKA